MLTFEQCFPFAIRYMKTRPNSTLSSLPQQKKNNKRATWIIKIASEWLVVVDSTVTSSRFSCAGGYNFSHSLPSKPGEPNISVKANRIAGERDDKPQSNAHSGKRFSEFRWSVCFHSNHSVQNAFIVSANGFTCSFVIMFFSNFIFFHSTKCEAFQINCVCAQKSTTVTRHTHTHWIFHTEIFARIVFDWHPFYVQFAYDEYQRFRRAISVTPFDSVCYRSNISL